MFKNLATVTGRLKTVASEARQSHEANSHCEARSSLMKGRTNNKQIAIASFLATGSSLAMTETTNRLLRTSQ
jgi:hypothetical protein